MTGALRVSLGAIVLLALAVRGGLAVDTHIADCGGCSFWKNATGVGNVWLFRAGFCEGDCTGALNIEGQGLTDVPAHAFEGLPGVTGMSLANNQLSSLPAGLFAGLSTLSTLDLSQNELTSLPSSLFADLGMLLELVLSENALSRLDATTFAGLGRVTVLALDQNAINLTHHSALAPLLALTDLDMSMNKLTTLPPLLFANNLNLSSLGLDRNYFTGFLPHTFDGPTNLISLALYGNTPPLSCLPSLPAFLTERFGTKLLAGDSITSTTVVPPCVYGCDEGEYLNSTTPVPPEGVPPTVVLECVACPGNSTTSLAGATGLLECHCDLGYTGPDGGLCEPCIPGSFKNASGPQNCSLCPAGTFSEEEGADSEMVCEQCSGNDTTTSPPGSANASDCVCASGYVGTPPDGCSVAPPPETYVEMVVSLPFSLAEFNSTKQASFITGVAAAAGVDPSKVTISRIVVVTTRRRLLASSLQVEFHIAADDMADAQALASTLDETSINTALVSQGLPAATVVRSAAVFVVYADGPGIVIPVCVAGATFARNSSGVISCAACSDATCPIGRYRNNCTAAQDSECVECSGPLFALYTSPGEPNTLDNCTWVCPETTAVFTNSSTNVTACLECTWPCDAGQFRSACDCLPCANWKPPGAHYSGPGSEASFNQCQWACDDGLPANETHGEECGIFCRV
mmetsp:Transcript_53544/g.127336  ORF Transcript_53544/g.127336 Transcript_53544/m.127336 type:complete len:687 (+) Transcript_53544:52-2112(+)